MTPPRRGRKAKKPPPLPESLWFWCWTKPYRYVDINHGPHTSHAAVVRTFGNLLMHGYPVEYRLVREVARKGRKGKC